MAVLTVTPVALTGPNLPALLVAAAAAGDLIPNVGQTFVVVKNVNAAARTVTIKDRSSKRPANSVTWNPDVQVVVAQNEERIIGPFDPERFNDGNGQVKLEYDDEADVTVAAFTTRV